LLAGWALDCVRAAGVDAVQGGDAVRWLADLHRLPDTREG